MTIKIYPSRLEGEPVEVHQHGETTLHQWMSDNVSGYRKDMPQRIAIEVDGISVPPARWPHASVISTSDIRIFPIPGVYIVGIIAAVYSIYVMSTLSFGMKGGAETGDSLSLDPAKANSVRLGDPIREILGKSRVYPDYLVQSLSRFDRDNPRIYRTSLFLSIGVGNLSINPSDIRIGNTPVSAFGDDVSYTLYPPGADVSGDARSENWFSSTEVSNTASGTAGLDLASTGPDTTSITADAISLAGTAITVIGESAEENDSDIPSSWKVGTLLTVIAPETFTVAAEPDGTVIYGDMDELAPYAGMPVTLTWTNTNYQLFVSAFHPGSPAVPGVGGTAASVTASAAPAAYDFSSSPATFTLGWAGGSYVISLTANYVTMTGLTGAISDQLTGSGLIAASSAGRLKIGEEHSPFSGNSISYAFLPASLFGDVPVNVSGVASSGGAPAVLPSITLAYGSASGTPFSGLPAGQQRLSIAPSGNQYRIAGIDGLSLAVERMVGGTDGSLVVDASWPGFSPRVLLDAIVTGIADDYDWMGPFLCCPESEKTDRIELNFVYPQGLVDIGSKDGKIHWHEVELTVQYRLSATDEWTSVLIKHGNDTVNEIGYTETIALPAMGNYEVRVKRDTPVWGGTTRDSVQWQAMRARLSARPSRYRDVTTIALTVRTGNRLAAQSDRRISIIATRLYEGYPSRSVSGGIAHVLKSAGMDASEIDIATLAELEASYWTPRGETFDFSADTDGMSVLDMMQKITTAGMGYFILSDGLASAGREGVKPWTGIISPHEQTEALKTSFTMPSQDDYDGVDVTYINGTTWAEETVQCRTEGNPVPLKTEAYKLDGVLDEDRAWRIGMRRLMKHLYQREGYETTTELDARCYNYGDRIILTDDIPGSTTSCLIIDMESDGSLVTLHVSEPLDWSISNPRCLIRFQDGSASGLLEPGRIDDYTLTLPETEALRLDEWVMGEGTREPPRLIFCSSERAGCDAIVSSIDPSSDGTTAVSALQYTPLLYQHDDAVYPGNVT